MERENTGTTPEPVINRTLLAAVFQILALAGLAVSQETIESVTVLILAVVPLATVVAGLLARRKVTPIGRNPSSRA